MYQALSHFSILQATESWAGPGNEAKGIVHLRTANCSEKSCKALICMYICQDNVVHWHNSAYTPTMILLDNI